MGRELKVAPHFVKAIDNRTVTSIFAVHGNVDSTGDRGWPGMFSKTWQERPDLIQGLWQHDGSAPPIMKIEDIADIGKADLPGAVLAVAPDAIGGAQAVCTYLDTPRGNEVLAGIKAGAIKKMSYMYDAVKYDFEENPAAQEPGVYAMPIRNLREVRLYDVSPVNWGANDATVAAKAGGWLLPEDLLLKQLQALLHELKEGRRTNATDQKAINQLHDLVMGLGADNCKGTLTQAEPDADAGKSRAATAALTQAQRARLLELTLILPAYARQ